MAKFKIGSRWVGNGEETYFIADISANHDGDLGRAKDLIRLSKEAGANAAKFQHFRASEIVSDGGFRSLSDQLSHQASWQKSVFEVYEDASIPWDWTSELKSCCDDVGIDFFSTPYDLEAVDMLDEYVPAYKIGSGDITWLDMLDHIARKQKPVILATGASNIGDVQRAVDVILRTNRELALLQCNTDYTANVDSARYAHLNVLKTYQSMYPDVVTGLSDHTFGHVTVLGAVALGGRVVEKHFTDDNDREGPDHPFSMNPKTWREMVDRTRELERALGSADKRVQDNERATIVVQRRCLRAKRDLAQGTRLTEEMIAVLRPATPGSVLPFEKNELIGKSLRMDLSEGQHFTWDAIE